MGDVLVGSGATVGAEGIVSSLDSVQVCVEGEVPGADLNK